MAIKQRTSKEEIRRMLEAQVQRIEDDLIKIMQAVGEKFVFDAKKNVNIGNAFPKGAYKDHTTNLRGSIGCFVLKNGTIINRVLDGSAEGMQAAESALSNVPKVAGIQLVAVAGMRYASYVESKGFNVIRTQADAAVVNLEKMWKDYAKRRGLFTGQETVLTGPRGGRYIINSSGNKVYVKR